MSNQEGKKEIKSPNKNSIGNFKGRKVSIDEKIEIFESFFKDYPEKKLSGKTVYKGYPIGHWAIQIRSQVRRQQREGAKISFKEEQCEKLEKMGILERQLGPTIDEKIQALVDWSEEYPKVEIALHSSKREECLKQYVQTEQEFQTLLQRYELIHEYYQYVIARKSRRKIKA